VFKRITKENEKIDIVVNNAWAGYEDMREGSQFTYFNPSGVGMPCLPPTQKS
jgi:hypothetical protein